MLVYLFFCLIFSTHVITTEFSADYIGDVDNFHISYSLRSDNVEAELQRLLKETPDRVVSMKTADQEEYKCVLPVIERMTHQQQLLDYKGPNPAELVKPLIDEKTISMFGGNGYWFYDFAHGRYILQYHDNRETKERMEYSLGNYRADQSEEDAKKFDEMKPPKTKIRDVDYPYYPVHYRHGTPCDLTGKPRETTVMYVCHESARHMIYSITEVSTCNYELIVLTNLLCTHPAFQAPTTPEHEIYCYASPNAPHAKPAKFRELQKQIYAENIEQYSMASIPSIGSYKSSTFDKFGNRGGEHLRVDDPLPPASEPPTDMDDMDSKYREDFLKAKTGEERPFWKMIKRIDNMLSDDDYEMMSDFWDGKSCFIGGYGYWRYEFCYGSKITQFHIEGDKRTREIVLGEWNRETHLQWFQKNKDRALLMNDDGVLQVSHYYSNGDFCDETGGTRSVEVRIKCRDPPLSEHPTMVFLTVNEPKICHYILTLQAGLFCERLQEVDEKDGLISPIDSEEQEKLLEELEEKVGLLVALREGKRRMGEKKREGKAEVNAPGMGPAD